MDLLAEAALGANGEAIADDQDSDHELRIDRGPANRAIERLQRLPYIAQIKEAVDPPQQMIIGNVILQAEVIEKLLRCRLRPHHRSAPLANRKENGITAARPNQARLNQQNRSVADVAALHRVGPLRSISRPELSR